MGQDLSQLSPPREVNVEKTVLEDAWSKVIYLLQDDEMTPKFEAKVRDCNIVCDSVTMLQWRTQLALEKICSPHPNYGLAAYNSDTTESILAKNEGKILLHLGIVGKDGNVDSEYAKVYIAALDPGIDIPQLRVQKPKLRSK